MQPRIRPGYFDEDRYERSRRLEWFNLEKIKRAKVLVVGCGAIGNESVKNLVLAGFRRMTLVDMDYVVRSNLNRCIFFDEEDARLKRPKAAVVSQKATRMDNELEVDYISKRVQELPEDFVPFFDIVLGCLDNVEARLHLNAHCYYNRVPYIDAATLGLIGKVQVIIPPKTPCFECGLNKTHLRILGDRFSCTGEDVTYYEPKLPAEITTTCVVSAVQVRESIKIILGRESDVLQNVFYYDGLNNISDVLELSKNPECCHHMHDDALHRIPVTEYKPSL